MAGWHNTPSRGRPEAAASSASAVCTKSSPPLSPPSARAISASATQSGSGNRSRSPRWPARAPARVRTARARARGASAGSEKRLPSAAVPGEPLPLSARGRGAAERCGALARIHGAVPAGGGRRAGHSGDRAAPAERRTQVRRSRSSRSRWSCLPSPLPSTAAAARFCDGSFRASLTCPVPRPRALRHTALR